MENSVIYSLGFDPVIIIIAQAVITLILLIVVIIGAVRMRQLYRRYDYFMRGKDAESMETMIINQMNDIIDLKSQDRANKDSIRTANKNSRAAFQKMGVVKYNAFKDKYSGLPPAVNETEGTRDSHCQQPPSF